MELRELRAFIAVAEELNFNRAAERLNMTQPPLTRLIRRLEHSLGVELFERTTRKVALTKAGNRLLDEAMPLIHQADAVARSIRHEIADRSSKIVIGCTSLGFITVLPDALDFGRFLTMADAVYAWRETGDTLGLDIRYEIADFGIELNWNSQFVFEKTVFSDEVLPAYDVHSVFALWKEPVGLSGVAFGLGVDNLFDETYAPHAGRTGAVPFGPNILDFNDVQPGRNIKFTVEKVF